MLVTPTGYAGDAEVVFFLQLENSSATLERFTVELTGVDVALSRELMTRETTFPGSYIFVGSVKIPGDGNPSNDNFTVEEPFIIEALSGEPHDIGVEITSVTPSEIAPGDTLTFEYTLLNLTGYSGPVDVTFQLSTSSSGRVLLTEEVTLNGEAREIVREVATPADLQIDTFRPVMRVAIENDTAPANNIVVFREVDIVVTATSQVTTLGEGLGDPPPLGELTEGNLSEWQLEAYRGNLPVNPGVRTWRRGRSRGGQVVSDGRSAVGRPLSSALPALGRAQDELGSVQPPVARILVEPEFKHEAAQGASPNRPALRPWQPRADSGQAKRLDLGLLPATQRAAGR